MPNIEVSFRNAAVNWTDVTELKHLACLWFGVKEKTND